METIKINSRGDKRWYKDCKLHREGGLPAIKYNNGNKWWYKDGKLHREIGPAIEMINGYKAWYKDGKLHCKTGPAIESPTNGYKAWYKDGKLHREGGLPAIEYLSGGGKRWYIDGNKMSKTQNNAYVAFSKKMNEKNRIRAQKIIYFWWIQICYDLSRECGQRMAKKNFDTYQKMM